MTTDAAGDMKGKLRVAGGCLPIEAEVGVMLEGAANQGVPAPLEAGEARKRICSRSQQSNKLLKFQKECSLAGPFGLLSSRAVR